MLISRMQADLLHEFIDDIQLKMDIKIGYCSVFGSFQSDEDDYVIYETGDIDTDSGEVPNLEIHLLDRAEIVTDIDGIFISNMVNEKPEKECKTRRFFQEILQKIERGILDSPKTYEMSLDNDELLTIIWGSIHKTVCHKTSDSELSSNVKNKEDLMSRMKQYKFPKEVLVLFDLISDGKAEKYLV